MDAVGHFLVASLLDAPTMPPLSARSWALVPERAADHGLAPRIDALIGGTAAPEGVRQALHRETLENATVHMRALADLGRLAPALERTGIPWAVVKGPVLAEHWYTATGQRSYVDLDVVVDPAGFGAVLDCLEASGAALVDRNFTHALRQRRAELSFRLTRGSVLDLHWHVLNTPILRTDVPLSVHELLARRELVDLGGLRVPTLDPADTLLHLCLHTMLSGGQRLSWYRDLQQVVATGTVDWDQLLDRTVRARARQLVGVALARARRLAGAPVPSEVERELARGGRSWQGMLRALDVTRPLGRPLGRRLSGQLLVEASRDDARTSRAALRRSLTADLIEPFRSDPEHPWRRWRRADARVAANPLWDAPEDDEDRVRYVSFVESQPR